MRVVDADDLEGALSRAANDSKMLTRIHDITAHRIIGGVTCGDRFENLVPIPQQQSAAFCRAVLPGVRDDGLFDVCGEPHTSITIAMPMPPPMQRLATPRPPPRFFNA